MTDVLTRITYPAGAKKAEKRVGRGQGSGLGTTCGRGQKGQKTRKGGNIGKLHFQGGQTPLQRRLPKRGFNNPFPIVTVVVNVGDLESFAAGSTVDEAALRKARIVQGAVARIKVLGDGALTKKLTVSANRFSKSATHKIEKAGGKVVIVPELQTAAEQQAK
jgi:large subunit ribosomal protein L15